MAVFQDSYPMDNQTLINNSRLFIIHMPSLLEKFLTMFRAALDEKYQNILRILPKSDIEQTFKDEVGEEILPEEYGGTNGTIEEHVEFWKQEVPRHSEFLAEQTRLRSDESLRPGKPRTAEELFGSCSIMWSSLSSSWSSSSSCDSETDISVTSVTTQQHRGSKLTLPFLVTTSFEINLWMIFNFYSLHCMHLCKNYLHDNSCPIFAWINSNLHQFPENLKHCKIIGNFLLMQTKLPEQIDVFNWDKRSYKKNIELSAET